MNGKMQEILKYLPETGDLLALLDALAEEGASKDEALDLAARLIDDAIPCDVLVQGPQGALLETVDGALIRAILGVLWSTALSPQAREARKKARAARNAATRRKLEEITSHVR